MKNRIRPWEALMLLFTAALSALMLLLPPREAGTYTERGAASEGYEASAANGLINVNTAGAGELDLLPGIGPAKAAEIIGYRQEHGPFESVDELLEVPGIGEATLDGIAGYICLEDDE